MIAPRRARFARSTALLAGVATVANAQYPIETLTFSIEWENDVSPSNPMVKGAVWATISPDIGATVAWNTKPGTGQLGTLEAFASTIFNTSNVENGATGKLAWTVPTNYNVNGKIGTPDGNGGIHETNVGQFGPPVNTSPLIDQKVKLLDLTWVTSDFSARHVQYETQAIWAKVYLDVGLAVWVGENASIVNGSGGFWVVPAPSVVALIAPLLLVATKRRRTP